MFKVPDFQKNLFVE